MAGKLTLDQFINCFGENDYTPVPLSALGQIDDIKLSDDVFIKFLNDDQFIKPISKKVNEEFGSKEFHFFSWIEFPNNQDSSFWLFPVITYQNNNIPDLINNAISLIKFRHKIIRMYNAECSEKVDDEIKICVVGYTDKNLEEINKESGEIYFYKRQAEIIFDNIKEIPDIPINVELINHQFEQKLNDVDILILPNGIIGNAIYRAWVSTGLVPKSVSGVIHKQTQFPLWVGRSVFDPIKEDNLETKFSRALWRVKELQKIHCALITTNQVEACLRALSGLIQGGGLKAPILINLATGTGTYPDEYSDNIKKEVLAIIQKKKCTFLCFSMVDLFLIRTMNLIKYLKDETGLPVIVGGIHAEIYPDESIAIEGVDAICVGEAYSSFVKVLRNWEKRDEIDLPDFWFKNAAGKIKKNGVTNFFDRDDFNNIPIPDYSYRNYYLLDGDELRNISSTPEAGPFKVEQHQIGHAGSVIYSSMGGCSNRCSYCNLTAQVKLRQEMLKACGANSTVKHFRHKPLTIVKQELNELARYNRNMKFLCVMENDFTCRNLEELAEYCHYIKDICNVPFYTMVAPNTISEEKLKVMVDNGFMELNMGIQTNADFNKTYYDRHIPDQRILDVVTMVNNYKGKVYPFYDFINFNPEESDESMKETITLIRKFPLPFDFVVHHLTLGNELLLYKRLIREKKIPQKEVMKITSSDFHNLNIDDYKSWKTLYMNLVLEWIAGSHDEKNAGRLSKEISALKKTEFGKCLFSDPEIKGIDLPDDINVFDLLVKYLYPVLNRDDKRPFLKELNSLLPELLYRNQREDIN